MTTEARQSGAVLARRRAVTRPAHDRLEGALGLLDERLDRNACNRVLERFYGFWRGWEPQVAALLQDRLFLEPRRRTHMSKADLAVLGSSARTANALPACPLPLLHDAAGALGSLYVMEARLWAAVSSSGMWNAIWGWTADPVAATSLDSRITQPYWRPLSTAPAWNTFDIAQKLP